MLNKYHLWLEFANVGIRITRYNVTLGLLGHTGIRRIHNHVRPTLYALRYRKEIEKRKNPIPKPPSHRNTFLEWNYNAELFAFGKRLNEEFDSNLLRQAFVEKSYAVKERLRQEELNLNVETLSLKDNESMSQEGMTILKSNLNAILAREFPRLPESGIHAIQGYLTSDSVLSNFSSQIGTKDLIQCNEIPPTEETLSRVFCGVISAIQNSSGRKRVKTFIEDFVLTHLCDKDINEIWDVQKPWAMLTDILSSKGETIEPRLLRQAGKNTLLSVFIVGLYTSEKKLIGTGTGETVEIAQEMAARDALSIIHGTRYPRPTFKFLIERQNTSAISTAKETTQLKLRN